MTQKLADFKLFKKAFKLKKQKTSDSVRFKKNYISKASRIEVSLKN